MLAHHTWLQPAPRLACGVFDYDCTSGPPQFSWRSVAASAITAGVAEAVGPTFGNTFGGQVATRFTSGLVAQGLTAKGGKINVGQIAADAFGSAIGNAIVGQITQAGQQEQRLQYTEDLRDATMGRLMGLGQPVQMQGQLQGMGPWSDINYRNGGDIQDDLAGEARAFAALKAAGASEDFAKKIAPQYRELMADPKAQALLTMGGRAGTGRSDRPQSELAARIYDKVLAQRTDLVGLDIAKQQAYETSLLAPVVQHVNGVDAFIAAQGVNRVSDALLSSRQAMAAALTSKDVYYDTSIAEILPNTMARQQVLNNNGIDQSGLYGATYSDSLTGKTFVAMRGTEFGIPGRFEADIGANAIQLLGGQGAQYSQAVDWARELSENIGAKNLIFTGHSLGGGLASAMANVVPGSQGITFNSAGLHPNSLPAGFTPTSNPNIQAYYVKGELISALQDNADSLKTGLSVFPGTRDYGLLLQSMQVGPRATGQRIALEPVVAPDRNVAGVYYGSGSDMGFARRAEPFNSGVSDMLTLHGQTQLLWSLSRNYQQQTAIYHRPEALRWLLKN
jgi:hypothetical protein